MDAGTLVAVTPEFLHWLAQMQVEYDLGSIDRVMVNQGGEVAHVGYYSASVVFPPNLHFTVPKGITYRMAQHEKHLFQCARLIHAYRRSGGFRG